MSRFVSGGTNDEPTERDEAWLKAQEQIEAIRRNNAELGKQDGGKSLYETLQANKAAKQDAFEESIRLKNQFRSLDDDEVEFLDAVLESTRAKEALVKKETAEGLETFRKQQEEAERTAKSAASLDAPQAATSTSWAVSKKRKKGRDDILGGAKLRKSSTADRTSTTAKDQASAPNSPSNVLGATENSSAKLDGMPLSSSISHELRTEMDHPVKIAAKLASPATVSQTGLGLGAYSSDED